MRILIVSQYFLPQPLANAEVIGGLAAELQRLGHDVHVVTPATGADIPVSLHHAFAYFSPDRASVVKRLAEYVSFSVSSVIAGLRAPRPDVILVPSPPPTLGLVGVALHVLRRRPFVYNVQDLYPEVAAVSGALGRRLPMRVLTALMAFVYRSAAAVVVIDRSFVDVVSAAAGTTPVLAIRNAIDRGPFADASPDPAFLRAIEVPTGRPVIMYAGNIGRSQDLEVVARACAGTDAVFVIHGDGAGRVALESKVREAGWDHVRFSPYRSRDELGRIFASADVHVVPLRGGVAHASVPSKLLSIFSAGRPAIVMAEPDSAASAVVAEAGGGWVVAPGDEVGLRRAIEEALADPESRADRGRSAAAWSEHGASMTRCAEEYAAMLHGVVAP